MIELYHATDQAGVEGIKARGFAVSYAPDSDRRSWFQANRDDAIHGRASPWWVTATVPIVVARAHAAYLEDGSRYLDYYLMPWDVVNDYAPFGYERADAGDQP